MYEQQCKGKKLNSISGEYVQQGVKMKPFQSWFGWRPQITKGDARPIMQGDGGILFFNLE